MHCNFEHYLHNISQEHFWWDNPFKASWTDLRYKSTMSMGSNHKPVGYGLQMKLSSVLSPHQRVAKHIRNDSIRSAGHIVQRARWAIWPVSFCCQPRVGVAWPAGELSIPYQIWLTSTGQDSTRLVLQPFLRISGCRKVWSDWGGRKIWLNVDLLTGLPMIWWIMQVSDGSPVPPSFSHSRFMFYNLEMDVLAKLRSS